MSRSGNPRKKSKGKRTTEKKCSSRSNYYKTTLSHKFTSKINELVVCSWCGKPQAGKWPTFGLPDCVLNAPRPTIHKSSGRMFK